MEKLHTHSFKLLLEIFIVSSKLGLTSFGGPVAHLGYFHEEYVRRKKWMDEESYADLVALCQFLPGPASSQVGIGIGIARGGWLGGIVSFLGFTTPSVLVLMLFAYFYSSLNLGTNGWIHGLKLVAVAIVAHAIIGMAQKLTPDLNRKAIALFSLIVTLLWESVFSQVIIIIAAGLVGYFLFKQKQPVKQAQIKILISKRAGFFCITLFFALLFLLPVIRDFYSSTTFILLDSFYRSGALVFGGGHVVLPLLERELVPSGLISSDQFIAGYGITQAVPGPLFTFSAYLGTVMNGFQGGIVATFAIFLPAFLLVYGTLPFWYSLRNTPRIQGAWLGVNAAVVGILISTFYHPIWVSSIAKPIDFAICAILFSMLSYWKLPPWVIVVTGAIGGMITTLF